MSFVQGNLTDLVLYVCFSENTGVSHHPVSEMLWLRLIFWAGLLRPTTEFGLSTQITMALWNSFGQKIPGPEAKVESQQLSRGVVTTTEGSSLGGNEGDDTTTKRPFHVSAAPSRGQIRFVEEGVAFSVRKQGFLRIHADLSGLLHFVQEAQHHYAIHMKHGELQRVTKTSEAIDHCIQKNGKWSLLSPFSALSAGSGWTPGRLNDSHVSHQEPAEVPLEKVLNRCLYPQDSTTNITEGNAKPANLSFVRTSDFMSTHSLGGLDHYAFDLAIQVSYAQLSRCSRTFNQQLQRFFLPSAQPRTIRQLLALLGVGAAAFAITSEVQIWGLRNDLTDLGAEVDGYVTESRSLARTVGAFIDHQTNLTQTLAGGLTYTEASLIRTRGLLQLSVITSSVCEITSHIVRSLDDLEDQKFPANLFTEGQLQRFLEEMTSSIQASGLEPVSRESTLLHFLPAVGVVLSKPTQEQSKPVDDDHLNHDSGEDMGIVTNYDEGRNTTTLKIRMSARKSGSVKAVTLSHEDHSFANGVVTGKGSGLELAILLQIPLKQTGDPGFNLIKLDNSLVALNPPSMEKETSSLRPEVILAQHPGVLIQGHGPLGAHSVSEAQPDFLEGCQKLGGLRGPFLCSRPAVPTTSPCLKPLFHNFPVPDGCLEHFKILDPAESYILGDRVKPLQVFVSEKDQMRTFCPGDPHSVIQSRGPGLYALKLPPKCTVLAGHHSFTRLLDLDLQAKVVSTQDLNDLRNLEAVRDLEQAAGWKYLKELRQEVKHRILTLRDLQKRVEEGFLDRIKRQTPHVETYFWLSGASLAILLLTIMILWVRKRNRQQLRRAVTRDDSNRQMRVVFSHLNRHQTQFHTGAVVPIGPHEISYRPVQQGTLAIEELPVEEVLLEDS